MKMPNETQNAVDWALKQKNKDISVANSRHLLVDYVRKYFKDNNIECEPMTAKDLDKYLPDGSKIKLQQ